MTPTQIQKLYRNLESYGIAQVRVKLANGDFSQRKEPFVRLWLGDQTQPQAQEDSPKSTQDWHTKPVGLVVIGVAITVIGAGVLWVVGQIL